MLAKVGIKSWIILLMLYSVDLLEKVVLLCMHRCNHPAGIVFAWTDTNSYIVANTAW